MADGERLGISLGLLDGTVDGSWLGDVDGD